MVTQKPPEDVFAPDELAYAEAWGTAASPAATASMTANMAIRKRVSDRSVRPDPFPGISTMRSIMNNEAARRKNDPADLINVALEKLVEGSFEPGPFRDHVV